MFYLYGANIRRNTEVCKQSREKVNDDPNDRYGSQHHQTFHLSPPSNRVVL